MDSFVQPLDDELENFSIKSPATSGNTWIQKKELLLKINNSLVLYKELGKNIARRREELGLSQRDIATILNTGQDRIKNLELGRCRPSGLLVKAIAQCMGLKLADLIPHELLAKEVSCNERFTEIEDEELTLFDFMEEHYFHVAMGRKILRQKRAKNLNLKELAKRIQPSGIGETSLINYLRKLEKGDVKPDIFFLAILAGELGVAIDDLFPRFEIDKMSGFAKLISISDLAVLRSILLTGKAQELLEVIDDRLAGSDKEQLANRGNFYVGSPN